MRTGQLNKTPQKKGSACVKALPEVTTSVKDVWVLLCYFCCELLPVK